ncbi:MAG: TonB-dependent receptor [Bryobacteraceae bacterium]|nr:TonB-dependent receptor [Bryobacteraceae bacterium]
MLLSRLAALGCLTASLILAQAQTGTVSGGIFDGQTGRGVVAASVAVNGQTSDQQVSDSAGKFVITLSPGTYTLTISAKNYSVATLTGVLIKAGENTEASTVLSSSSLVTTIDVVERATSVAATSEAMLQERKLASTISDNLSHQELMSGTSSDAAGALEKVTGVSVVGDGFVFVRGLGERYSSTQLNGALIPTTEPERRVVPLDLFPAGLIENIKILKTYSADLPAEFSGGMVQLQTVDFPTQKIFSVSMKSGFNTATTFNNFKSYPGGSYDFFGFDNGTRALPSNIPSDKRLFPGQFTQGQLQEFGRSFSNNWEPATNDSMRPAVDWSAVGGGTWGRFGLVGALTVSNKPQNQREMQRYIRQGDGKPFIFTDYPDFRDYTQQARLGGIFNASVRLTPNSKIMVRNTFTHDTEKSAREFSGYDGGVDSNISSQRLRWVERSLLSTGIEGDHALPKWKNSVIHWQFTYSNSKRDEPDLREVFRGLLPNGSSIFSALGSSGIRFFSNLDDRIYEPQADYSIPFFKGSITGLFKVGVRATLRKRDFGARRFRYIPQQLTTLNLFAPSNQLFAPDNIRPSGFQIVEFTRGTDRYDAEQNIIAGYAMVDLGLGARWRVVAGLRIEDGDQTVTTIDNLVPGARPVIAGLTNRDPAPAVNLIYALNSRQNFRLSYSRTLSRPDFRELSPFDFNNTLGGFVTQGNPDLVRATISNFDARWEWFTGGNQIIAASVFGKLFNNPIEQTILPANDLRQTYVNAAGARNVGLELEARKNLGSFAKKLREFSVVTNFTFVDSNIDIRAADASLLTTSSRPLLGQSRFIFNVIGEWTKPAWHSSSRFYTNFVSRRITDVGTFGVPDIYQEGNTNLDFVHQYTFTEKSKWTLRFEAENLTDNRFRWTQGNFDQRVYQLGRTFQVGLGFSFF